jgi:hypothetical protein
VVGRGRPLGKEAEAVVFSALATKERVLWSDGADGWITSRLA